MRSFRSLLFLGGVSFVHAQSDDFDDGADEGWTRYAPLQAAGGTNFILENGTYTISCAPSPDPVSFGPARAGSFIEGAMYADFCVSVEISGWDALSDTSLGLLARVQPELTPGAVSGYALTFQSDDLNLEISRVDGEEPTAITAGGALSTPLQIDRRYRLVFFGLADHLEGRIYDPDDLSAPLFVVRASDPTFESGINGLVVFSETNRAAAATFDNYRADAGEAPAIRIERLGAALRLSWPAADALCWELERSDDLADWEPAPPPAMEEGEAVIEVASPLPDGRFFRFAKGPR